MKFPKHKAIRLKGKAKIALYRAVYERDDGRCQRCRAWVPEGTIPHHITFKSQGGSDIESNLALLCPSCHYRIHHGGVRGSNGFRV